jgi:hypothetical protein
MTQFSIHWILSLNRLCQKWGQVHSITYRYEDEATWSETLESAVLGVPHCAFFQWPQGMILNTRNRRIVPGLSIRGNGDWITIPPSTNIAGSEYKYRDPETPIAPAPRWIIKKFFVEQDGLSSSNIVPFPKLPVNDVTSAFHLAGSASGIILPFSTYSSRTFSRPGSCHRVQMLFHHSKNGRWICRFVEDDLQETLPRTRNFLSAERLIEISERGGALRSVEERKALSRAIERGWGGAILKLTEEQYSRLKENG